MADIFNLRQHRKSKARAAKEQRAEENRVQFGLGKAEKSHSRATKELDRKSLDSHRIDAEDD